MARTKKQSKPTLERTTYRIVSESAHRGTTQVVLHDHWSDGSTTSRTKHVQSDQVEALYGPLEQETADAS